MHSVRQPAVAGLFYPDRAQELASDIKHYLHHANAQLANNSAICPKALIVPHAGYAYSGAIAAQAYATLSGQADSITKVVLLGPAHRVKLRGLAISDTQYFRTPLGDIAIDRAAIRQLLDIPQVHIMDTAHWQEHSLEVQLPFLQTVLNNFALIPVVIGDATASDVQQVLDMLWHGPETLIVISSDLSHYHGYATAQTMDQLTCDAIENFDSSAIKTEQACGCTGVQGLLRVAKDRDMKVHTLALSNSGDTSGDQQRVVGYGSWAFSNQ